MPSEDQNYFQTKSFILNQDSIKVFDVDEVIAMYLYTVDPYYAWILYLQFCLLAKMYV